MRLGVAKRPEGKGIFHVVLSQNCISHVKNFILWPFHSGNQFLDKPMFLVFNFGVKLNALMKKS